jgi:uncharacterized protein
MAARDSGKDCWLGSHLSLRERGLGVRVQSPLNHDSEVKDILSLTPALSRRERVVYISRLRLTPMRGGWAAATGLGYTWGRMVTARQLAETLRARSADRRARADARAERLRILLPEARQLLVERYRASRVVLFGSLATGGHSERSDVDLAVLGVPSDRYFHALADLMVLFGGPVDLVRIEEALPSLRSCIEEEGHPL